MAGRGERSRRETAQRHRRRRLRPRNDLRRLRRSGHAQSVHFLQSTQRPHDDQPHAVRNHDAVEQGRLQREYIL